MDIFDNPFIDKARIACIFAHQAVGQKRKYSGKPYYIHPIMVALLVSKVTDDEEVIAAALLHDVLEDTLVQYEDIGLSFSDRVAKLVSEVTDISRPEDGNRATRKAMDREHLAKASPEGKTIKLADLIHNTESIVEGDPNFAEVYMAEKKLLLPLLEEGDKVLWSEANVLVESYYRFRYDV